VYHKADFDGIFCREIAKLHFGDRADYVGWDYGDPLPCIPPHNADGTPAVKLYMLDISIDDTMGYPGLVWIDHHKTAIEKYPGVKGYQIDGVAACRLAWQYFSETSRDPKTFALPEKHEFLERTVSEPRAVRLAGEYDIWDKRDPAAELFQHGLRSRELTDEVWYTMLKSSNQFGIVEDLLNAGRAVQFARRESDRLTCLGGAFELEWEGLRFLALNSGGNSLTFASAEKPEHDGLLMFRWGADKWRVSLYHSQAHKERDLSEIAKKYGGGGHRGACGFECSELPFRLGAEYYRGP